MITETEFLARVRYLVNNPLPRPVQEVNSAILALASELTIARNARNRLKLAAILDNGRAASQAVREGRETP